MPILRSTCSTADRRGCRTLLGQLAGEDRLGWCYWWQAGHWQRAGEPTQSGLRDGHRQTIPGVLSDQAAVRELGDWVMQIDRPDASAAPQPEDVDARARTLLATARAGSLSEHDVDAFAQLCGPPSPEAISRAVTIAGVLGVRREAPVPWTTR